MSVVIDLARFYLGNELVRDAEATLPSDYDIESSFVEACNDCVSFGLESPGTDHSLFIERNSLLNEILNGNDYSSLIGFNMRPVCDLVEVISSDDDGNVMSFIAAKVFDSDDCFFFVPVAFPINIMRFRILAYLTFEQRIGFLTELVRVFSNLVRFHGSAESLRSDLVGCLGQLVGFLRLAVRDYCEAQADCSDDGSGNAGDDSPFHVASLSGGGSK